MELFGKHRESTLVVYVTQRSVAAVVACLNSKEILATVEQSLPEDITAPSAQEQLPTLIKTVCGSVIDQYSKSKKTHFGPVGRIEIHLGPSLSEATTAEHTERYDAPMTVTDAHIREVARKALAKIPENGTVLERHIIRVRVNGYPTKNPIGSQGHILSVTVFQSTASAQRTSIEQAVSAALTGHTPATRSFAKDLLFVCREHADEQYHLVVAVDDTKSYCLSLRGDDIAAYKTIDVGSVSLLSQLTTSSPDARSQIRLAARDACAAKACEDIKARLAAAEPAAVKTFGDGFATLSAVYRLPNDCLLLADPDLAPWFEHILSRLDFAQFTVTSQPLKVAPAHARLGALGTKSPLSGGLEIAVAASSLYTPGPTPSI